MQHIPIFPPFPFSLSLSLSAHESPCLLDLLSLLSSQLDVGICCANSATRPCAAIEFATPEFFICLTNPSCTLVRNAHVSHPLH